MFGRKKAPPHPLVTAFEKAVTRGDPPSVLEDATPSPIETAGQVHAVVHILKRIATFPADRMVVWAEYAAGFTDRISAEDVVVTAVVYDFSPALARMEERLRKMETQEGQEAWITVLAGLAKTYTQTSGERVVQAIQENRLPGHIEWNYIFGSLRGNGVATRLVFAAFSETLPPPLFMVHMLHLGKAVCLKDEKATHPLNQPAARDWFEQWILDAGTHENTAIDAAASLAFITQPWAPALTACALRHPTHQVRLEAAWSLGKLGDDRGLKVLADECHNFRTAGRPRAYLAELGRLDLLPAASQGPEFVMKIEISEWVAHYESDYKQPPEEIETVYQTEAVWPGLEKPVQLILLKYRVTDKWGMRPDGHGFGCAPASSPELVCKTELRSEEHACYEDIAAAAAYGLFMEKGCTEIILDEAAECTHFLHEWLGAPLENPEIRVVTSLDPPVPGLPVQIAVAEASINGASGWAVIESPPVPGTPPLWYDAALRPESTHSDGILAEHAGRRLLGWPLHPGESNILRIPSSPIRPPEEIAANFEHMVSLALESDEETKLELLSRFDGRIPDDLDRYCESLKETSEPGRLAVTAMRLLPIVVTRNFARKLVVPLAQFGHAQLARNFMTIADCCDVHGPEEISLALARHALNQPASWDVLRDPLQRLAKEFHNEAGGWRPSRLNYQRRLYNERIAALRTCCGDAFQEILATWNLPESL